jgi:hypothetical protein
MSLNRIQWNLSHNCNHTCPKKYKVGYIELNPLSGDDINIPLQVAQYILDDLNLSQWIQLVPIFINDSMTNRQIICSLNEADARFYISYTGSNMTKRLYDIYFSQCKNKYLCNAYATVPSLETANKVFKFLSNDENLYPFIAGYLSKNQIQNLIIWYDPTNIFSQSYANGVKTFSELLGIHVELYSLQEQIPIQPSAIYTAYLLLTSDTNSLNSTFEQLIPTSDTNLILLSDLTTTIQGNGVQTFIEQTPLSRSFQVYIENVDYAVEIQNIFPEIPFTPYVTYLRPIFSNIIFWIRTLLQNTNLLSESYINQIEWTTGRYNRLATYIAYRLSPFESIVFQPSDYFERLTNNFIIGTYQSIN